MAEAAFGPAFEIHGGGLDLVFPHHENELAQSRALGHEFAKLWMHNGMLKFSGEKMSKSLGNDVTLRNVLDTWGREVVLLFFLSGHWRKPIDFNDDTLTQARAQVDRFSRFLATQEFERSPLTPDPFNAALDDDFNTPQALALMHEWVNWDRPDLVYPCLDVFGVASLAEIAVAPADVVALAEGRQRAREAREFEEADRLRAELSPRAGGKFETSGRDTAFSRCESRAGLRPPAGSRAPPRPARGARALGDRAGRQVRVVAARDRAAARAGQARPRSERGGRGTRDHQGVLAWCEPYGYADEYELAATERPLLACLDQVSDPRNLGAVCRSAEGAGATGVVAPAHGSARVTPAVCPHARRSGRPSAGVAVVTNSPAISRR